jgi:hypothetical protein
MTADRRWVGIFTVATASANLLFSGRDRSGEAQRRRTNTLATKELEK